MRGRKAWLAFVAVASGSVAHAAEPPPLIVTEATNNEVAIRGVAHEQVEFTITVLNQTKAPVKKIVARLADFRNEQFGAFSPTLEGANGVAPEFELPAFDSKSLRIRVALPKPGDYAARFSLLANNALYAIALKVNRTALPAPALEFGEIQPVLVNVPFLPWSSNETDPRSVRIRETAGAAVTLPPPELQWLTYKPRENVAFAVPAGRIVTIAEPKLIPAKGSDSIDVAIADIPRAGRYEATIRFAVPDAAPVTRTISILARQSWVVAAVFIAVGVLVAFVLRLYLSVLQPRFALQSRVALLFQQFHEHALQAGDDLTARQVVEHLRDGLAAKWDTLSGSTRLIGSTDFDIYEAKMPLLENWLRLRKWLPKGLPASVRKVATDTLFGAEKVLGNTAATAAEVDAQLSKLGALPAEISNAAMTSAQETLGRLKTEFQASTDAEVRALLAEVDELLALFGSSSQPLDVAFERINGLRRRYVEVLSRALLNQLDNKPPFDMDVSVWNSASEKARALLAQVASALDADVAAATYFEAVRSWLRPQLSALSIDLSKKAAVETPKKAHFQALRGQVDALLKDVDAGKLDDALTRVSPILDEYKQLLAAAGAVMGPAAADGLRGLTAALTTTPAAAGAELLRHVSSAPTSQQLRQRGSVTVQRRAERSISAGAIAIILVLALLSGIKALWMEDWTWGGGAAYLVAFLWGAGLTGFTYDGISGLIKRFTS